jgi:hypothetical protein
MSTKEKYILYLIIGCLSLFSGFSYAQRSTVRATIQPSDILIGEQAIINLEVIAPKDRNIIFPLYPDTLIKGIEVLKMLPPDTTMTEVMTISQKYLVTSFDSTLYHIPYMQIVDGNDTIRSNDFGLKVSSPILPDSTMAYLELLKTHQTDSIDFEKLGLYDIKPIQDPPFVWQDYIMYILIPLLILLIMALLGFVLYMILNKKKKGYYFKPQVVLPPHVIALKELDELKASKIWQKGQEKMYYTKLTDVLREYIDRRFGIDAPEMTSDEILAAIKKATGTISATENLKQILYVADLVKFAKYIPLNDENDLSMMNAYFFVNQTKIEEVVKPENPQAANNTNSSETGTSSASTQKPAENNSEANS